MNNGSKLISASEINRYLFCHYQWYYERLHGKKYLREQYKKRNEELGYTDSSKSNFIKGQEYHKNYMVRDREQRITRLAVLIAVFLVVIFVCYFFTR